MMSNWTKDPIHSICVLSSKHASTYLPTAITTMLQVRQKSVRMMS